MSAASGNAVTGAQTSSPANRLAAREEMSLPPLNTVEAALRKTTELLARELFRPSTAAPDWSEFEWCVAKAVATMHGISGLLANTLRWQGPDQWRAFLCEQRAQTILRAHRIRTLLARIDAQARTDKIDLVALKGAALTELGLYEAGERPMGDIDLLVEPENAALAAGTLGRIGYAEVFATTRHRIFEPPEKESAGDFGEHIGNPLKIELHEAIAEHLPVSRVDITALCWPRFRHSGLSGYPSVAALMRHLLLHAAANMRARALRLIQLHDIAMLATRMGREDWHELMALSAEACGLWWALPPLRLTERYYPGCIPPSIIDAAKHKCPRLLQRASLRQTLIDVSWSRIHIQAFPGVEWSASIVEAARFMKSRVWPSRAALTKVRYTGVAQPWSKCTPWYGEPHWKRIVRWVFSKPPRVQTIHCVRAALSYQAKHVEKY